MTRELAARLVHPCLQFGNDRSRQFLANGQALGGRLAVDVALDGKEPVDDLERLGRQRRDERRGALFLVALELLPDVDELEEFPACMNPAICARHGLIRPAFREQGIEAGISVDLENTGIAGQVGARMLAPAIAGVVAQRHWRRRAAERAIVAHIVPYPRHAGFQFGQKWNGGVVGM